MAAFLTERNRYPDQVEVNTRFVELLAPVRGERWIEAGCGTGAVLQIVAQQLRGEIIPASEDRTGIEHSPVRRAFGVDRSAAMLQTARQLAVHSNGKTEPGCTQALAESLPYPTGCFDGGIACRLLLHITEPQNVVRELARVVRAGGRVGLMDWDFETVVVEHTQRELTRRILHWRTDQRGGNNWSGRQLLRLALQAGLKQTAICPIVSLVQDTNTSLAQSLLRAAEGAVESQVITNTEHAAWIAEIEEQLAAGSFFASVIYFVVLGRSAR